VFHRLPPPTDADIAVLLARVQRRVRGLLSRRGRWPDAEAGSDPFAGQEPLFASAVAASLLLVPPYPSRQLLLRQGC
jgi:hypothetical protein